MLTHKQKIEVIDTLSAGFERLREILAAKCPDANVNFIGENEDQQIEVVLTDSTRAEHVLQIDFGQVAIPRMNQPVEYSLSAGFERLRETFTSAGVSATVYVYGEGEDELFEVCIRDSNGDHVISFKDNGKVVTIPE